MSGQTSIWKSGLAWVLLSPLALLMALISTVESLTVYYIQVAVFGAWAACGVVAGITRMASVSWAGPLQVVLLWIAFAYFCASAVLIAVSSILLLFKPETRAWGFGLSIAVGVFLTGVPFLYFAKKRKVREDRGLPRQGEKPPYDNA